MRARYPDEEGLVERSGASIHYEVYENDGPTVFLMPTWQIIHSRHWKMQIPYLSRHYRVVTFDAVGNGKSDRHTDAARFRVEEVVADAVAVMDHTETSSAVLAGLSYGGGLSILTAALHPDRIDGIVVIGAAHFWSVEHPDRLPAFAAFEEPTDKPE